MPAIMLRRPLAGIVALSALMPFAPVAVDTAAADTVSADAVVKHYADLAHANYADALNAAQALNERIDELLANPTAETPERSQASLAAGAGALSAERSVSFW